jgi:thiamine-monophosphate kinase
MPHTDLSTLGEFALIDRLASAVPPPAHKTTVKGIGDDAAVIDIGQGRVQVVTTDLLLEGIHFDLSYCPLKHLGYKAVAVNISDIAAMNAIPTQITVSVGVSNRFSVEALDELYAGIAAAAEAYQVDIVGGDTTSSRQGLIISITAIGVANASEVVYRSGASPGEVVCVTGDLGAAYLGLQVLQQNKAEFLANPTMQPQLDERTYVVSRQLKPEARMDIIHELRGIGVQPTAMIDISDGLGSEVLHLAKQSNVGFAIYEESLPMADEAALATSDFHLVPATVILSGGEDYELLMTFTQADYDILRKTAIDITAIGITRAAAEGCYLHTKGEQKVEIIAQGWQAFAG